MSAAPPVPPWFGGSRCVPRPELGAFTLRDDAVEPLLEQAELGCGERGDVARRGAQRDRSADRALGEPRPTSCSSASPGSEVPVAGVHAGCQTVVRGGAGRCDLDIEHVVGIAPRAPWDANATVAAGRA